MCLRHTKRSVFFSASIYASKRYGNCKNEKESIMKRMLAVILLISCVAGCVTMSGSYKVTATKKDGAPIPLVMSAQGSNIYTARNAICSAYPGATVTIVDVNTGKDAPSESPYKCK